MTTKNKILTKEWVNIVDELSLIVGKIYTLQNRGIYSVEILESELVPTTDSVGILLDRKKHVLIKPEVAGIWCRATNIDNILVVVSETV